MTIRLAKALRSRIRQQPDQIVIHVAAAGAEESARRALRGAREEIGALDGRPDAGGDVRSEREGGPKYVSEVLPTPQGGALFIDGGDAPYSLLLTIPDVIARRLVDAGVEEAAISAPPLGGELDRLGATPRAVILRLYAPRSYRRGVFPAVTRSLVEEAALWLTGALKQSDGLLARLAGMEFALARDGASEFLTSCHRSAVTHCNVVAGGLDDRVRAVSGCFLGGNLALAAGGPATTDHELAEIFSDLKDFARRVSTSLAYAFIDVAPSFAPITSAFHPTAWWEAGGESPETVEMVCDEAVFDAFPYQVLGPRHLARLGGPPPGAQRLAGGELMELEVAEVADWLPGDPDRERTVATARSVLAPCLLQSGESTGILRER